MLETVDLSHTLDRQSYVREVTRRQIQLRQLGYQVYLQKRPVIIVFEGASPKSSIRAVTWFIPSAHRTAKIGAGIICTVSGDGCRNADRSPSLIAPGTAACWWSEWKGSPARRNGSAPTRRSTPSNGNCATLEWSW
jgi:hypothetical protein